MRGEATSGCSNKAAQQQQQQRQDLLLGGIRAQKATAAALTTATTADLLRQASRHANAALETGQSTTRQLQVQGEQMEVINRALDDVEHELNVSDRTVRSMSWTGKVKNWFTSKPRKPQSCAGAGGTAGSGSASAPSSSSPSAAPPRQQRQQEPRRVGEAGGGGSSSSNGETGTSNGHLSKEEDKLLDTLLNSVGAMREQASLQGELLAGHNRRLDEMSAKTDAVRGHMERTDRSVRKLL